MKVGFRFWPFAVELVRQVVQATEELGFPSSSPAELGQALKPLRDPVRVTT